MESEWGSLCLNLTFIQLDRTNACREEYRELPWLPEFLNVCPGSCDPNCQFYHAFVVVDCYKILDHKDVEPHARHPPKKNNLDSRSIIIQQQKQIWSCFVVSIHEFIYIYVFIYIYLFTRYIDIYILHFFL